MHYKVETRGEKGSLKELLLVLECETAALRAAGVEGEGAGHEADLIAWALVTAQAGGAQTEVTKGDTPQSGRTNLQIL